jgi:hypothetical protein
MLIIFLGQARGLPKNGESALGAEMLLGRTMVFPGPLYFQLALSEQRAPGINIPAAFHGPGVSSSGTTGQTRRPSSAMH